MQNNIVVVTLNIRVGVLGFMKVPGGDYNCGIHDIVQAITCVKQIIGKFGGDTGNITLAGLNSGGSIVAFLMASNLQSIVNK